MRKIFGFVRQYPLFTLALLDGAIAFGLKLGSLNVAAHWALSIGISLVLAPLLWQMIDDYRHGTYGANVLAAGAIISSIVMHEYWAGLIVILLLTGNRFLDNYTKHQSQKELDVLLRNTPKNARVIRGRKEVELKASEVYTGNKLIIRPGELVATDAQILEGVGRFDESNITGNDSPNTRGPGDIILSGSINLDGTIIAKALHSANESQYHQIIKAVRAAARSQAPLARMADRYVVPFTVISFGIAGMAWALSGESIRFLQVLTVATPFSLDLAAPLAMVFGLNRATKQGIIAKNSGSLERLAKAKTFVFNETDTQAEQKSLVDKIRTSNSELILLPPMITPEEKIRIIEEAKNRPLAFVGDGIDNAPFLTASDIGIALGARGYAAASESADITIMVDDIGKVLDGRQIAKHTLFVAKQSILLGTGLSMILMLVFATGEFKAIYGAAAQGALNLAVVFNVLRARNSSKDSIR
ncbi:MAG TPA: hypothetical protein VF809_03240, partial [Candidatus Saccharimonadales bacterium]